MGYETSNKLDIELLSKFQSDLNDFRIYAKKFLKIKDEYGRIIPLIPNSLQEKVLTIILDLESRGKKIWLNILKCRQTGISTLIEAYIFWRTHAHEMNQKVIILGHEQDASQNLFDMFQRYLDNLPGGIKPPIDRNQRDRKLSYLESKNEITVHTAGSNIGGEKAGTGRSATYQYIHSTECAYYPDYITTFAALLQASKYAKLIVKETTANGFNEYRNDWLTDESGESDYTAIFLCWLEFYEKSFESETEKELLLRDLGSNKNFNAYDNEENILMDEYNATLENLNWRRWAIINLCKKDIDKFHQEYPRDSNEAFVSSGRPVFNATICAQMYAHYQKLEKDYKLPYLQGDLSVTYDVTNEDYQRLIGLGMSSYQDLRKFILEVKFIPNNNGFIKILGEIKKLDIESRKFAAAVDVAEGLEQGDYSTIQILNRKTREICIEWHGHLDVDLFSNEIHKLQLFLHNDVYFAIEKNNQGLAVIVNCEKLDVNLYYTEEFQTGRVVQKDKLGFSTNQDTKRYAINNLIEWVREAYFTCRNSSFWSEALTFVRDARGRMSAQNKLSDPATKCFDDRVMAMAILTVVHAWMPNFRTEEPNKIPIHLQRKLNKYKNLSVMSE